MCNPLSLFRQISTEIPVRLWSNFTEWGRENQRQRGDWDEGGDGKGCREGWIHIDIEEYAKNRKIIFDSVEKRNIIFDSAEYRYIEIGIVVRKEIGREIDIIVGIKIGIKIKIKIGTGI